MKKNFKILIADPDNRILDRLGTLLTQHGYSVLKVQKGKQAFQFALKVDADLCLLDSQLEDVNGFAVCRSIRKRRADLPVLVCSSIYKGEENAKKAQQKFLANELIEKPCSDGLILDRIQFYLKDKEKAEAPVPKLASSLENKLEQTLSGLELTGMAPKKKKKSTSSAATIQVNTEELKKELNKLRTGKPVSSSYREKPQFKVGSAMSTGGTQGKLSSHDIFGDLISDIEKGSKKNKSVKPQEQPEPTIELPIQDLSAPEPATPPPPPKPAPPVPSEPPEGGFLEIDLEDDQIDALPGFKDKKKDEPPSADSKANDYELIEKIAAGGMAEVWKARLKGEKGFEKIVAIKKILPHLSDNDEFISMFIDEAKVAANLTHPNIAQIYELGKFGDTFFIAMEYVSGQNLRHILNYCKSLNVKIPPSIVAFIGVKLCNALDYAHRKRDHSKDQPLHIVHRDISPQNILISVDGEIKLVDFGIAKATIKAANTVAGSLKGKLLYMSPEQAEGKPIDHRSDIFSLGNVLYECLTGTRLVDGDSELSILKKVREADFIPPRQLNSDIPHRFEHVLLKSLQKEVSDRFATARELEKDLKNFMKMEKMHITETDVAEFIKLVDAKEVQKINQFDLTRSNLQRDVILPDRTDVRKFEQESLLGLGDKKKGSKKWIYAAIAIPVIAVLAYFITQLFFSGKSEIQQPEPQNVQNEQMIQDPSAQQQGVAGDLASESETQQETTGSDSASPEGPDQAASTEIPPQETVTDDVSSEQVDSAGLGTKPSETETAAKESGAALTQPSASQSPSQKENASGDLALVPTGDPDLDAMQQQMLQMRKALENKQKRLTNYKKENDLPVKNTKSDPAEKSKKEKKKEG